MSNYDHRILKFLNQNINRSPTITDMMTKLNISITDISDSLKNLLAQGLITRRINAAGIECWSPAMPQAAAPTPTLTQAAPVVAAPVAQPIPSVNVPQAPKSAPPVTPVASTPVASTSVGSATPVANFMGGPIEKPMTRPEPVASTPKPGPVPVQHFSLVDKAAMETQTFPAMGLTQAKAEYAPMSPAATNPFPMQKQNSPTVSWPILILCLLITSGFSIWIAAQVTANKMSRMQKSFVDQKSLNTANSAINEFQVETKSQLAALEAEVKTLREQLTAAKASSDSVKEIQAVADASPKSTAAKNVSAMSKIKPGKKTAVTKITKAEKLEKSEKVEKTEKPVKTVKAVKPAPTVVKNTAVKAKKVKSASAKSGYELYSEPAPIQSPSSNENSPSSSSSSSSPDAGPTVPAAPGLDNQDLPPASGQ